MPNSLKVTFDDTPIDSNSVYLRVENSECQMQPDGRGGLIYESDNFEIEGNTVDFYFSIRGTNDIPHKLTIKVTNGGNTIEPPPYVVRYNKGKYGNVTSEFYV